MNAEQDKNQDLIDTTDCLEAMNVFKCWKNLLFAVILLCLLFLQAAFWVVELGYVKTGDQAESETISVVTEEPVESGKAQQPVTKQTDKIEKAAEQVIADVNQPTQETRKKKINFTTVIKLKHLAWLVRFLNFMLIPIAVLYCLTMLFSLKVSMLGR